MKRPQFVVLCAWTITLAVSMTAIITWGSGIGWDRTALSIYTVFPLFGLLAFSIMWAHYAASVLRQLLGVPKPALHTYFETTSLAVLALILLHPGLISFQLWRDGFGLPLGSEFRYVGPTLSGAIVLGAIALVLFGAYELRRWYSDRPWWRLVELGTDLAMVLIFIHALRLGSSVQAGWFRGVWFFYGVSLLGFLLFSYSKRILSNK